MVHSKVGSVTGIGHRGAQSCGSGVCGCSRANQFQTQAPGAKVATGTERETNVMGNQVQTITRKWDIGLLIAFLDFLCKILDPMNANSNLLTMQIDSIYRNQVVLGLK